MLTFFTVPNMVLILSDQAELCQTGASFHLPAYSCITLSIEVDQLLLNLSLVHADGRIEFNYFTELS